MSEPMDIADKILNLHQITLLTMNTIKTIAIIAALTGLLSCGKNENSIRINQVGFYPGQEKTMTDQSQKYVSKHRSLQV